MKKREKQTKPISELISILFIGHDMTVVFLSLLINHREQLLWACMSTIPLPEICSSSYWRTVCKIINYLPLSTPVLGSPDFLGTSSPWAAMLFGAKKKTRAFARDRAWRDWERENRSSALCWTWLALLSIGWPSGEAGCYFTWLLPNNRIFVSINLWLTV